MSPEIRPARLGDDVAPLLYEASPPSYDAYFAGRERALRKLRGLARHPGHEASWEICWVAEEGRNIVGVLAGFPAAEYDARSRRGSTLAFGASAPWRWPAMLRVNRQDAQLVPPPGSWYVDSLAVAPAARRRGVGRALMLDAERHARESGFASLALDTAVGNAPAGALYESLGLVAGTPIPGLERFGALGGAWVPYVKAL